MTFTRCKHCRYFDTAPGMKWGVCKAKSEKILDIKHLVKGPEFPKCPQAEVKEE